EDHVGNRVDQAAQEGALAGQGLLGLLAVGDVRQDAVQAQRAVATVARAGQDAVTHPAAGAVRPDDAGFFLVGVPGPQLHQRLLATRPVFRVDDAPPVFQPADEEVGRPARDLLHDRRDVAVGPVAGLVDLGGPQAVGDRGHDATQLGLHLFHTGVGL